MDNKTDFNQIITSQLTACVEADAQYSELILQDSGFELSIIIKRLEEEE